MKARKTDSAQPLSTLPAGSFFPTLLATLALLAATVALVRGCEQEKIGVVRTADLVSKYEGMKDARAAYEARRSEWQGSIDTLKMDYEKSAAALEDEWEGLSPSKRKERSKLVATQEQNFLRYAELLEERIDDEEGRLSEDVIAKVNEGVKRYAEEHGYDVVYGATIEGSILYSDDALDITDELIEALNDEYASSK